MDLLECTTFLGLKRASSQPNYFVDVYSSFHLPVLGHRKIWGEGLEHVQIMGEGATVEYIDGLIPGLLRNFIALEDELNDCKIKEKQLEDELRKAKSREKALEVELRNAEFRGKILEKKTSGTEEKNKVVVEVLVILICLVIVLVTLGLSTKGKGGILQLM